MPTASESFFRPTMNSVDYNTMVINGLKTAIANDDFVDGLTNLYGRKFTPYEDDKPLTGASYGKGLLYMVCLSPLGKVEQTVKLESSNGDKGYLTDMGHDFMKAVYVEFAVRPPNDPSILYNSVINKGTGDTPVCQLIAESIGTTIIAVPRSDAYDPTSITPSNRSIADAANLYKQMLLSQISVVFDGASTPIRKGIYKFNYAEYSATATAAGGGKSQQGGRPTGNWEKDMLQELNPELFMGSGYFLQDYLWIVILNSIYGFYQGDITIELFKEKKDFFHSILLNYFFQILAYHIEMNVRRDLTLHTPERTSHVIQSLYVIGHLFFFGVNTSSYNTFVTYGKPTTAETNNVLTTDEIGHVVRIIGSVRADLGLRPLKPLTPTTYSKYVPAQPHCGQTMLKLPIIKELKKFNTKQVVPRGKAEHKPFADLIHALFEGLKTELGKESVTLNDESEVWLWMMIKYMGDQGHITNADLCDIFYLFYCWFRENNDPPAVGGSNVHIFKGGKGELPKIFMDGLYYSRDSVKQIKQTSSTIVTLDTVLQETGILTYGICADSAAKYFEVCDIDPLKTFYKQNIKNSVIMKVNEMSALFSKRDRLQSCCNFNFIPEIGGQCVNLEALKNYYREQVVGIIKSKQLFAPDGKITSPEEDNALKFKSMFDDNTIKTFLDLTELCKGVQSILTLTSKDVEHICKTLHEIFAFMINPNVTSRKWTSPLLYEYDVQKDEDETMYTKVANLDEIIFGVQFFSQLSAYGNDIGGLMNTDGLGKKVNFDAIMLDVTEKCNAHITGAVQNQFIVDLFLAPAASDNGKTIEQNKKMIGFPYMIDVCCQVGLRAETDDYNQLYKKYEEAKEAKKAKEAKEAKEANKEGGGGKKAAAKQAVDATNPIAVIGKAAAATNALAVIGKAAAAPQGAKKGKTIKGATFSTLIADEPPTPPAEWYTGGTIDLKIFMERVTPLITSLDCRELFKKSIGLFKDILKMLFAAKFDWKAPEIINGKKPFTCNSFETYFPKSDGTISINELKNAKIIYDIKGGLKFRENRYTPATIITLYEEYMPYPYNRVLKTKYKDILGGKSQKGGENPIIKALYERQLETLDKCTFSLGKRNKLDSYYQLYNFYIDMKKKGDMIELIGANKSNHTRITNFLNEYGIELSDNNEYDIENLNWPQNKELRNTVDAIIGAFEPARLVYNIDDSDNYKKRQIIDKSIREWQRILKIQGEKPFEEGEIENLNRIIVHRASYDALREGCASIDTFLLFFIEHEWYAIVRQMTRDIDDPSEEESGDFSAQSPVPASAQPPAQPPAQSPVPASATVTERDTLILDNHINEFARDISEDVRKEIIKTTEFKEYTQAKDTVHELEQISDKIKSSDYSLALGKMMNKGIKLIAVLSRYLPPVQASAEAREDPRLELLKYLPKVRTGGNLSKFKFKPLFFNYEELTTEYNKLMTNIKLNDTLEQLYTTYGDEVKSRILLSYPDTPMIPGIGDAFTYDEYDGVEYTDAIEDELEDDSDVISDDDSLNLFYHYFYKSELVQKELYNAHTKLSGYMFNLKGFLPEFEQYIDDYNREQKKYVKNQAINAILQKRDNIVRSYSRARLTAKNRTRFDEDERIRFSEAERARLADTERSRIVDDKRARAMRADADDIDRPSAYDLARPSADDLDRPSAYDRARLAEADRARTRLAEADRARTRLVEAERARLADDREPTRVTDDRERARMDAQSAYRERARTASQSAYRERARVTDDRERARMAAQSAYRKRPTPSIRERPGGTRKKSTFHGGAFTITPKKIVPGNEFTETLQMVVLFGFGNVSQQEIDLFKNRKLPPNQINAILAYIQQCKQTNNNNVGNPNYESINALLNNIESNVINLDLLYKRKMVYLAKCIHHLLNIYNKPHEAAVTAELFIDYTKLVDMFMCYVAIYNSTIPDSHYSIMYDAITIGVYDKDTSTFDTTYNSYTVSPNDYIYLSDLRADYMMYKEEKNKQTLSQTKTLYNDFVIDRFVHTYTPHVTPNWHIIPKMYWYGYDIFMLAYFKYIDEQETMAVGQATMAVGQKEGQEEGQAVGQKEGQATMAVGQAVGQKEGQAEGQAEGQEEGQEEGQKEGQEEGQAEGQAEGQEKESPQQPLQESMPGGRGKRSRRKNKKTRRKRTRKH